MSNTQTTNETLYPKKPFQLMRDFVAVAPINYSDLVMVVHPAVPADDLKAFIALAKAKPGQLNYASSGPGTPYHLAGELFKAMTHTDITHVPYKTSSGARTDVIAGQVQMMFDAITTMAPNILANQVRALGTTGPKRSSVLPTKPPSKRCASGSSGEVARSPQCVAVSAVCLRPSGPMRARRSTTPSARFSEKIRSFASTIT